MFDFTAKKFAILENCGITPTYCLDCPIHFCPCKYKSVFANDSHLFQVTVYKHSFLKVISLCARNGQADRYSPDKEDSREMLHA